MKPRLAVSSNIRVLPRGNPTVWPIQRKLSIIAMCIIWMLRAALCQATTVVVIVEDDRILMGADSLLSTNDLPGRLQCKIETPRQECSFTIVGMRDNPNTGFDPKSFADRACKSNVPLMKIANSFGDSVREPLRQALQNSHTNDPSAYDRDYRGKVVLEVVFAGFREGKPFAAIKTFSLDPSGQLLDRPATQVPDSDGNRMVISGAQSGAKIFLSKTPQWKTIGHPELIDLLILSEIVAEPSIVGTPVSILEITKTTHKWIKPGKCGNQSKE
jgi:hypothetical protein